MKAWRSRSVTKRADPSIAFSANIAPKIHRGHDHVGFAPVDLSLSTKPSKFKAPNRHLSRAEAAGEHRGSIAQLPRVPYDFLGGDIEQPHDRAFKAVDDAANRAAPQ